MREAFNWRTWLILEDDETMPGRIKESGQLVVPGEKLGVVEEFSPGQGAYEENGTIYAQLVGHTLVDLSKKIVSVHSRVRTPIVPTEGATVLGVVTNAQGRVATVNIVKIDEHVLQTPFVGVLHISSSSPRYERDMVDVCKALDIVRARVVNVKNRDPQLTTIGRGLGVVKAFCSRCGHVLIRKGHALQCESCRNIERRKIAEDYGRNSA